MRSKLVLAAVTLACAAFTATAAQTSAAAPTTGLSFYAGYFATLVANVPHPDGTCTPFPAEADSLVGWSNIEQVVAYRSGDCTGTAVGLGTLRTFKPGEFSSYIAH
ncbi:hypothetical protein [Vitiosangium sp. GDMCC 1.1324]|uniref:hypothetical protein n=1 Tax=Vitiosangium sp. (strain GDMCC 1.1324) TaxID=2138576 RepID=UPI000D35EC63|nr:hypothetical protein [Vitiosangium sp. GDMCC 1.1324]PTL81598.1 hypothetical protein DAT35_21820 [Vitiosangium sp. GDMCC 1.1324]